MKKVAIIISTYSQDKLLEKNIISIKSKNKGKNYKIYLIDDASENRIGEKIKKKFPFVRVIVNKNNFGFSKSNNIGIRNASREYNPDWFLIYNDDCQITDDDWLNKFIKEAGKFPTAGIFGCKLIYPDGSIQWGTKNGKNYFFTEKGAKEQNSEFSKTQTATEIIGACMLIRKEAIKKLHGFDEQFSPFYGEESDLCFRAKEKGFGIIYIGNLEIIHHRNKSISRLSKEDVWFVKKRNSIRLEWKHYSFLKILYYEFIHFLSIFKKDGIKKSKKFGLLLKSYKENFNNMKEIINFRRTK